MQANIIEYELLDRIAGEEGFIWQYDRGQKLKFKNVTLPFSYEVHFANRSSGPSLKVLGDSSGVVIPYDVTKTGKPVYLWLYVATSESAAQTVYGNTVPVRLRAEVATETPTPEQQGVIEQTISALNEGVAEVHEIAEGIPEAIDAALEQAKASGEFKGDPGAVFTPAINDGVMTWSNNGDLPNPDPVDFREVFDLNDYATKQELNGKVDSGLIGSANGVAGLDASGRVPSEQLPSYVDDVLEFASVSQFPMPGESGKIYISLSNNHQYRWTGSQYIDITGGDLESRKADKRDTVLETTLSRGRMAGTEVGIASIAFGNNVTASGYCSVATGNGTIASSEYANAEGNATIASGNNSHAEGYSTHATGVRSHAEGRYTWAIGTDSHAEGYYTQVEGDYAHGEGSNTHADGDASHSEGSYTHANGDASHAEGKSTITYSEAAHAEGSYTVASSESSHAEGVGGTFTINNSEYQSGSYGQASHSEGYRTRSQGDGAHSEGEYTVANAHGAHAEGVSTRALGYNGSHAEGSHTLASDDSAHAEGSATQAQGDAAHSEGTSTIASGVSSHAEGSQTIASGSASHTEGDHTRASGSISHAEGSGTTASGICSHAEGSSTQATASYAHAEGLGTTAGGEAAHTEGAGTQATGLDSHAEGAGSRAVGAISHAEGAGTRATGDYSHTEGSGTTASGSCAHVEGAGSQATGNYSHAEGASTRATASLSHAEGSESQANGTASHAEGYSTIANGAYSHTGGAYNVADSYDNWAEWTQGEHCVPGDKRKRTRVVDEQTVVEGFICKTENTDADWNVAHWNPQYGKMNYAEIIGNGTGSNARSNARTLDWEGNERLMGDLYVGCNADSSGGTKVAKVTDIPDVSGKLDAPSTAGTNGQVLTSDGNGGQSWQDPSGGTVTDVQVNGTSVLQNGIANVPVATYDHLGAVKISGSYGLRIFSSGEISVATAGNTQLKLGTEAYCPITPSNQHKSAFYGISKLAGVDLEDATVTVGTYPDSSKQAIQKLFGLAGLLGPYEDDTTADRAYAIGETFVMDGKRYRATAAISQDSAITPGTNCELCPMSMSDVQVNGTSVLNNGIANIPLANGNTKGVVGVISSQGVGVVSGTGILTINPADNSDIKGGAYTAKALVPNTQHRAVFFGLSKVAGVNLANETVTLGTYPDSSKQAIQKMLGLDGLFGDYQDGTTASKAYAIGDTFVMDGKRYKVTDAIADGGLITVGTNCELDPIDGHYVKDTDYATANDAGVVKLNSSYGIRAGTSSAIGLAVIAKATSENVKAGTSEYKPIVPEKQHESAFFGLSKAAGVDLANETITVGTYPATAKAAILAMLGANGNGLQILNGALTTDSASTTSIKNASNSFAPIVPTHIHDAAFFGLAKAAGADMASLSDVTVGQYPQAQKTAIQSMLGVSTGATLIEEVSGLAPTITAMPNVRYKCGEVSTISITPPASGSCEVIFTSGDPAAVLTVPSTVKFPAWFDATTLETDTIYDIIITDGVYGAVMTWES